MAKQLNIHLGKATVARFSDGEVMVELLENVRGKDVFVLLDSLTRVARAYNSVHGGSGRTMTGGVDARALEIPRKMFASARKIDFSESCRSFIPSDSPPPSRRRR